MSQSPQYKEHSIPVEILDEIAARFIVNLNDEERKDTVRICFQLEEAHWFYIDFYVNKQPHLNLQGGNIRTFAEHMLKHVHFLREHVVNLDGILEEWRAYKMSVPTYGAVILNNCLDKVLLVQGFWTKASWGFPKGKINQDEDPSVCAAREVLEETGYDISEKVDPNVFIEHQLNEQFIRLYIVTGVQENTAFETRTRCEIKDIRWFDVNSLPANKADQNCKSKTGYNATSFYMVIPFVKGIKEFVAKKNWERLQFQDEVRGGNAGSKKKNDNRKTPSAFTHHINYNENRFKSENKNPRRQLFDEPSYPVYQRHSSSRETTPAKQTFFDDFTRLTPQQQTQSASKHGRINDNSAKKIIKPVPQKAQMPRSILQTHTNTILAGLENAGMKGNNQSINQTLRVRNDLYEPIREVDSKPSTPPIGGLNSGQSLVPDGFCPKAWSSFSIDMGEVLRACLDDSITNTTGVKKRRRRNSKRK